MSCRTPAKACTANSQTLLSSTANSISPTNATTRHQLLICELACCQSAGRGAKLVRFRQSKRRKSLLPSFCYPRFRQIQPCPNYSERQEKLLSLSKPILRPSKCSFDSNNKQTSKHGSQYCSQKPRTGSSHNEYHFSSTFQGARKIRASSSCFCTALFVHSARRTGLSHSR